MAPKGGQPRGFAVDASGLNDLVRDLKKLDKNFGRAFTLELRAIGNAARDRVRISSRTPRDTGALSRSIKVSVRRSQISLYSTLPYAGVHEYGGTIKPRGTPITIEERAFVRGAVEDESQATEQKMGVLLDAAARRYAEFR